MQISILRDIKLGRKRLLEWDEKYMKLRDGLEMVEKNIRIPILISL